MAKRKFKAADVPSSTRGRELIGVELDNHFQKITELEFRIQVLEPLMAEVAKLKLALKALEDKLVPDVKT